MSRVELIPPTVSKIIFHVFVGKRPLEFGFFMRAVKRFFCAVIHCFLWYMISRRVVVVVVVAHGIAGDWTGGAILLQMRWLSMVRVGLVMNGVWLEADVGLHFAS
jgi:hypothetical protein